MESEAEEAEEEEREEDDRVDPAPVMTSRSPPAQGENEVPFECWTREQVRVWNLDAPQS